MRKKRLIYAIAVFSGLWGYCAPSPAQSTDPTGNLVLVDTYEDDFSTDKVRYDSYAHSVLWVEGAYPPDTPYLLLSETSPDDHSLVFRNYRGNEAHLVYCFPIEPDAVIRAFPMVLDIEMKVRFIPDDESGNQVIGQLCYYTSPDGINWPGPPTCLKTGTMRLDLGLLQDTRYVRFEGKNVVIDDLRASIYIVRMSASLMVPSPPYPDIQSAIDAAKDGDQIVVADDTYKGAGNTELRFKGKNITVISENGPENCIIDCEELYRGIVFDEHETAQAVLDGFTIRDARSSPGSGVKIVNSSPTISNCWVEGCLSQGTDGTGQGGGLYCEAGSPLIRDCVFVGNAAGSDVYGGQGGAVYLAPDAFATLERCQILLNGADQGGAIYIAGSSPFAEPQQDVNIKNCLIAENEPAVVGGGLYLNHNRVNISNCTIARNTSELGGGIYADFGGIVSSGVQLKNSIVWSNWPENINSAGQVNDDALLIAYCDIGEDWDGPGNINADPCFVGPGDYHLLSSAGRWNPVSQTWVHDHDSGPSPCIDAGSVDNVVGERGPGGQKANLGFYGLTAQASMGMGTLVFHVDKQGDDRNSGLNRQTAVQTIQRAIDLASDGDVVLIWPGTYEEEVGFQGKNITVQSAADAATVTAPTAPPDGSGYAFSFFQQEGSLGTSAPCVLRNLIIRNCAKAAVYCTTAAPTLTNLTIVENTLGISAIAPHDISVSSCIFWGNDDGDLAGIKEDSVNYSRLQSSSEELTGEGNIYSNPLFADPENSDFHLQSQYGRFWPEHEHAIWIVDGSTSPSIDAGNPIVFPRAEPHGHGRRINMGAYGGTGYASMSSPYNSCDLNRDGYVDFLDFAIFADNWLMD
jgi:hypothetical protein